MNHTEEVPEAATLPQTSAEEDVEKAIPLSRDEGWVAENDEELDHDQEDTEQPEEPGPAEQCTAGFVEASPTQF
jgi:hypothetical protein